MRRTPPQAYASELLGTCLLVLAVVGSGIMAERLSGGNLGIALLCNALATGAALVVLIETFGPISGAHFNPVVSFVMTWKKEISLLSALGFIAAQCLGGLVGVLLAHGLFDLPLLQLSHHGRSGLPFFLSEVTATFGLLLVILGGMHQAPQKLPLLVGAYITGAYWFTSSTSFANPAVTLARGFTDTFTGIQPSDLPLFFLAQLLGAVLAFLLGRWLFKVAP